VQAKDCVCWIATGKIGEADGFLLSNGDWLLVDAATNRRSSLRMFSKDQDDFEDD
jgi:hypothetical protein